MWGGSFMDADEDNTPDGPSNISGVGVGVVTTAEDVLVGVATSALIVALAVASCRPILMDGGLSNAVADCVGSGVLAIVGVADGVATSCAYKGILWGKKTKIPIYTERIFFSMTF
jgi:hypothetical protein